MVSDIPTQGRRSPEREDRHPEMEPIRPVPTATLSRHADMYRATSHVSGHDAIEAADSILPEVGAQKEMETSIERRGMKYTTGSARGARRSLWPSCLSALF